MKKKLSQEKKLSHREARNDVNIFTGDFILRPESKQLFTRVRVE